MKRPDAATLTCGKASPAQPGPASPAQPATTETGQFGDHFGDGTGPLSGPASCTRPGYYSTSIARSTTGPSAKRDEHQIFHTASARPSEYELDTSPSSPDHHTTVPFKEHGTLCLFNSPHHTPAGSAGYTVSRLAHLVYPGYCSTYLRQGVSFSMCNTFKLAGRGRVT